jgi:hypothetical protein
MLEPLLETGGPPEGTEVASLTVVPTQDGDVSMNVSMSLHLLLSRAENALNSR